MGYQESPRTARLRHWVMSHEPSICHERAAIVTECYERLGDTLPPVRLRARSLAAVLDGISIAIGPDELIVGNQACGPRAAPIFPEYSWEWVLEELDTLPTRTADRFAVPAASAQVLRAVLMRCTQPVIPGQCADLPGQDPARPRGAALLLAGLGFG